MSEIRKLELLERATIEATAWHWGAVNFPAAEAQLRRGAAQAAQALCDSIGVGIAHDESVVSAMLHQLDDELTAHIEAVVKTSIEKAQREAAEEQTSHLKIVTALQEHAQAGRKLFEETRNEDPASYEMFKKIDDRWNRELLGRVQSFHRATLEFIFGQVMMDKETAVELAKLYEVSLEIGSSTESA